MRGTHHRRDKGFVLEHQVMADEAARKGHFEVHPVRGGPEES
jgi:hypothetical protein